MEDSTEFPAYSRLLTHCHQYEGQHPFACKGGIPTLGIVVTTHIANNDDVVHHMSGQIISAWLPMSPWGSDCIFILDRPVSHRDGVAQGASRAVSEDPANLLAVSC